MNFLRQSTASQTRTIGSFVDDTDFKAVEDGLTIANTDIKLKKNGATAVNKNSGGATSDVNGMYAITFNATDTDTVGELNVSVLVSGALVVWKDFFVLEEAVFDLRYPAAATGDVKLQGITHTSAVIPTVTTTINLTTNNDKAGYALSAAGVDLIWDEEMALHTTADTSGLVMNEWQDGGRLDVILDARMAEASIDTTAGAIDLVTLTATATAVTNAVTVGTINANVINAASIASAALDDKGNWNVGKTGYSLTQSFPSNFADLSIVVSTGLVDITQTAADKVWGTTSRILTASTNFNDVAATDIVSAGAITTLAGAIVNVDLVDTLTTYTNDTPQTGDSFPIVDSLGVKKNVIFNDLPFNMVLSSDGRSAATGKSVTVTKSLDGATSFSSTTGSVTEIANGAYEFTTSAADVNGDVVIFKFTATDCDDTFIKITTRA